MSNKTKSQPHDAHRIQHQMKTPTSYTQVKDVDDFNSPVPKELTIVSIQEAESIVQTLQPFPVEEIGCSPFLRMYACDIERLTLQANVCAKRQDGDEYVIDAILTYKKLSVLVKTLLAIEAWRLFVLDSKNESSSENDSDSNLSPSLPLVDLIAENKSSLRCAFILHVETTLCSLLNLIFFRKENCDELDNDAAIALVDYCARQMASLAAPLSNNEMVRRQREPGTVEELVQRIQNRSIIEEIRDNRLDTEYKTAVVATSLARHLCEHLECLPIGAQTRILDTHDYLQMIVPLIDEPPWTRRRKSSNSDAMIWEKLHNNSDWKEVEPCNLLRVTQSEAQCWISVFHLTCSNVCREKYALNVFRKEQILRLRKYLNEVMLDQLPFLTDVMRYMDELALMNVPEASTGQGAALLMQQVDRLRESIAKNKNWQEIGKWQFNSIYSNCTDAQDQDLRMIAEVYSYNEDNVGSLLDSSIPVEVPPISIPLTLAVIRAEVNDSMVDVYNLTPFEEEGTIMQTDGGKFRRTKLKLHCLFNDPFLFEKELFLEAFLSINDKFKTLPLNTSLSVENGKTQWVQMGRTKEDNYFIQLGFKVSRGCDVNKSLFSLRQAFVSHSV